MKYSTMANRQEAIADLDSKLSDKTLAIFDLMNESFQIRLALSHCHPGYKGEPDLIRLAAINTKLTELIDEAPKKATASGPDWNKEEAMEHLLKAVIPWKRQKTPRHMPSRERKLLVLVDNYERSSKGSPRDRRQGAMMEMFGCSAEAIRAAINEAKEEVK